VLHRDEALRGVALRIAAMVCMAALSAIVKWSGHRGVPTFEIIFFRNAFAFIPLGAYVWRTTGFKVLKTQRLGGHLIRSAVGLTGMVCNFTAYQLLPLTQATALQFASPLFMTALSAWLLSERVGVHRWAAVTLGFVGVLIMARPDPAHANLAGVGFGVMSAFLAAGAMIAIRQISDTERGATIVFYFTLAGVLMGFAGTTASGWVRPDLPTLGLLVLAGLVGGLGQLFLTEAVRAAPLGLVAPFDYTQLIWAGFLGYFLWSELPSAATMVGAVIVAVSCAYILHRELRRFRLG
jgi:drug/metabolite transporter (DMT)-like permease